MKKIFFFVPLFGALIFSQKVANAEGVNAAPPRPQIVGISHAAFYVSDMAKAKAFYQDFFGYASPFSIPHKNGGELIWIKINDHQTIELFPGAEVKGDADR